MERQRSTLEQWWFAVQVVVCSAGVIPPKLKSRLPSKSSPVNTSIVIDLMVTKGVNAAISNACAYVSYQTLFSSPTLIESLGTRLGYTLYEYRGHTLYEYQFATKVTIIHTLVVVKKQ